MSEGVLACLEPIKVPPWSIIDGEWMGRRAGVAERIWLFDVLRMGEQWQNRVAAGARFHLLRGAAPASLIVPSTQSQYIQFYEAHQADPENEGIVLKDVNSHLVLSVRGCADNPQWLKVKWRAGSDGQRRVA